MSRQGAKIVRRLTARHGIKFLLDPSYHRVASDQMSVAMNHVGGVGCMQWVLRHDNGTLPQASWRDRLEQIEIGSMFGAWEVLKWPYWHVWFDTHTISSGIWWISKGQDADRTETK